jgi:hypothetical protein
MEFPSVIQPHRAPVPQTDSERVLRQLIGTIRQVVFDLTRIEDGKERLDFSRKCSNPLRIVVGDFADRTVPSGTIRDGQYTPVTVVGYS